MKKFRFYFNYLIYSQIFQVEDKDKILSFINKDISYDLTVCNPPFFNKIEDK